MNNKSSFFWILITLVAMTGTILTMLYINKLIKINNKIEYPLFVFIFLSFYILLISFWLKKK